MIHFEFPFIFDGVDYIAGCHLIPPPPDTQYHITPHNDNLQKEHGAPIIFHSSKKWHLSFPSTTITNHPSGGVLIQSLLTGLTDYLKLHPEYLP